MSAKIKRSFAVAFVQHCQRPDYIRRGDAIINDLVSGKITAAHGRKLLRKIARELRQEANSGKGLARLARADRKSRRTVASSRLPSWGGASQVLTASPKGFFAGLVRSARQGSSPKLPKSPAGPPARKPGDAGVKSTVRLSSGHAGKAAVARQPRRASR